MKRNVSTALKVICIILLVYVYAAGFLIEVPRRAILNETIRNLFFHVPMWFTMITLQAISVYYSIRFLRNKNVEDDIKSHNHVTVSIFFGLLGFITGMFWAKFTWGEWVVNDPKIIGSFIALLIYLPFLLLRKFIPEKEQRAVISAVYNVFAFTMGFILIFVIPRLTDSLHPGNGGNPGLNMYDVDNNLRMVFYPAVIGWILLGRWITKLKINIDYLITKKNEELD